MRMRVLLLVVLSAVAWLVPAATAGTKSEIFNGKNLDGWKLVGGTGPGYVVEEDRIVCPADGGGNLFTQKEYANFVLRLEFKVSPGGNNGVGLRAPLANALTATRTNESWVMPNSCM